ncbi:MAG: hypothetical protein AMXMBFR34_41900 [Myxococcaceae bacterium]
MPPFLLRWLVRILLVLLVFAGGAFFAFWLTRPPPPALPDGPTVVEKVRTAARLETLDVRVYRKVSLAPGPVPTGSVWGDLANWVKHSVNAPQGRAIVFADVHYGVDLSRLSADKVRVSGPRVEVELPPVQVKVELLPAETEVLGSNLDTKQTAELFDLARRGFEAEAGRDELLRTRARASAEYAVDRLLRTLGFTEVAFVEKPAAPPVR